MYKSKSQIKKQDPEAKCRIVVDKLYINNQPHIPECKFEDTTLQSYSYTTGRHAPQIHKTPIHSPKNNSFYGYSASVTKEENVRDVIGKIESTSTASNIAYAYRIHRHGVWSIGTYDGGDYGASSTIATLLETQDIKNTFVAVARQTVGEKLGPTRFELIKNTAENAIELTGMVSN